MPGRSPDHFVCPICGCNPSCSIPDHIRLDHDADDLGLDDRPDRGQLDVVDLAKIALGLVAIASPWIALGVML